MSGKVSPLAWENVVMREQREAGKGWAVFEATVNTNYLAGYRIPLVLLKEQMGINQGKLRAKWLTRNEQDNIIIVLLWWCKNEENKNAILVPLVTNWGSYHWLLLPTELFVQAHQRNAWANFNSAGCFITSAAHSPSVDCFHPRYLYSVAALITRCRLDQRKHTCADHVGKYWNNQFISTHGNNSILVSTLLREGEKERNKQSAVVGNMQKRTGKRLNNNMLWKVSCSEWQIPDEWGLIFWVPH